MRLRWAVLESSCRLQSQWGVRGFFHRQPEWNQVSVINQAVNWTLYLYPSHQLSLVFIKASQVLSQTLTQQEQRVAVQKEHGAIIQPKQPKRPLWFTGCGVRGHRSEVPVWFPGSGCGPVWGSERRFWTVASWLRCRWSGVCLCKRTDMLQSRVLNSQHGQTRCQDLTKRAFLNVVLLNFISSWPSWLFSFMKTF